MRFVRLVRAIELVSWGPSLYGWEALADAGRVGSVPDGHRDMGGDGVPGRRGAHVADTGDEVATVTGSPVRDALSAFLRTEARREAERKARMDHMRRVDTTLHLAGLVLLCVLVATARWWLVYAFAGVMGAAVILPRSLTWPGIYGWLRRR